MVAFRERIGARVTVLGRLRFAVALAGVIAAVAVPAAAQEWISYNSDPRNVLEGNWESCQDEHGLYAERIYDHVVNGVPQFEVHLGPKREFAIFKGVQDEHREHNAPENLLKPYRVSIESNRARRTWEIPSLKLILTVSLGGGTSPACESWYIVLAPLDKRSH